MTAYDPAAVCPDEGCTADYRHAHFSGGPAFECDGVDCEKWPPCYEPRPQPMPDPVLSLPPRPGLFPPLFFTVTRGGDSRVYSLNEATYLPAPELDPQWQGRLDIMRFKLPQCSHAFKRHHRSQVVAGVLVWGWDECRACGERFERGPR